MRVICNAIIQEETCIRLTISSSSSVCCRNYCNVQWLNLKNRTKDKPFYIDQAVTFFIVIRLPIALTPFQIWINGDDEDDLLIHATHENSVKPLTYIFLMFSLNSFSVLFKLDKKRFFTMKKTYSLENSFSFSLYHAFYLYTSKPFLYTAYTADNFYTLLPFTIICRSICRIAYLYLSLIFSFLTDFENFRLCDLCLCLHQIPFEILKYHAIWYINLILMSPFK